MKKETIVISLGGSLIVPDKIDTLFLNNFKKLIKKHIKTKRFIIVCGGGSTARKYMNATPINNYDRDMMGVYSTRLNAELVRTLFGNLAHPTIIKNPTQKPKWKTPLLIAAGWKPGTSSDYDAVFLAKQLKIKKIINLSNIDYVYTKDPKKYKSATKIKQTSWKIFLDLLPKTWKPGMNVPFDPVASRLAAKHKMKLIIMNGKKLAQVDNALKNKPFTGTIIE